MLRLAHPDHGGEHDLFVWVQALREHVAGDYIEDARTTYQRREPPPHPTSGAGDRLDFTDAREHPSFEDLTAHAVSMAASVDEPYAGLLRTLASCYPASEADTALYRAQHVGATWKQAAYIAHLVGMSAEQRRAWYGICEEMPLSQRHAGHLIAELQARAA